MQYSGPLAHCTCTPVVSTRFGGNTGRSPGEAITEAVAAAEGVAPTELGPLHHDIDIESIEQLFSAEKPSSAYPMRFECAVRGWNVYIRSDGALRVCDPEQVTDPEPVFEKAICD